MNLIPIESIIIPDTRQRQDFDPDSLMELTTSIADNGLLHAPVLRQTPEGFVLVAGERRLRAIKDLWVLGMRLVYDGAQIKEGQVPYVDLGELSPLEAEEAELDENLKRRDLSWQELASAHQRLHVLRQSQAVKDFPEIPGEALWTVGDTTRELVGRSDGAYQEKVRRELIVSRHLDNPEVQAAKSLDDAFKVLKAKENRERNVALAEEVGKSYSADVHELHNCNCIKWMHDWVSQPIDFIPYGIDVILTDPPYGMGADSFNNGAGKMNNIQHHYSDSLYDWMELMTAWCPLSYAVCKPQAHAYVFCDIQNFPGLKRLMEAAGWYVFRTPLIYIKPNSGRVPLPDQGPRRQWEAILYAIKGKKTVTHIYPDVLYSTADDSMLHGAQKTVEGFKNLLQRSVRPGDVVLDCFAGTGTIIPAAQAFQCKAIVIEQEKEYYAMCVERVNKLKDQTIMTATEVKNNWENYKGAK
jgi:DNA modification methylase